MRAHLGPGDDGVTRIEPARQRFADFSDLLVGSDDDETTKRLRAGESIGRPVGSAAFLDRIETLTQRGLQPLKRAGSRRRMHNRE